MDTGIGRSARPDAGREAGELQSLPRGLGSQVSLASLQRLVRSPVQFHVRDGLQARIPYREDPVLDTLPVEVDALAGWRTSIGLLGARDEGVNDLTWLEVEQARGAVPAGRLANPSLEKAAGGTDDFRANVDAFGGQVGRVSRPISVAVSGRVVTGVVAGVEVGAAQLGRFEYKVAKPHHRLALWLDLAALTLMEPSVDWLGVLVVRPSRTPVAFEGPMRLRMRGTTAAQRVASATQAMDHILRFADQALREPLPVFSLTSYALADPDTAPLRLYDAWDTDAKDDYVQLAFRGLSWRELRSIPPTSADPELAGGARMSRVGHWADWLWGAVEATAVTVEGLPTAPADADGTDGDEGGVA